MRIKYWFAINLIPVLLSVAFADSAPVTVSNEMDDIIVDASRIRLKKEPVQSIAIENQSVATRPSLDSALLGQSNIQVVPTPLKGSNISLNGSSGESVALFWDGDPILGRIDGALDARAVSLGTVNRIAVYQGVDSLPFGSQNVGGVISLETPWKTERQIQLRSSGGSFGRTLLSAKASNTTQNNFNYIGAVNSWRSQAVRSTDDSIDTYSDATAALSASGVFGRTGVAKLGGKEVDMRVGVSGFRQNSRGEFGGELTEGNDQRTHVFADIKRESSLFHLSYGQARHEFKSDFFDERAFRFGPQLEETLGNWTVLGGSVFDVHQTRATRIGERSINNVTNGTYAGARYAINEHWAVGAGSRYDSGPNLFSPRAELRYMFSTGPFEHATIAETGLGFREVTAKERYLDFSNPAVGYHVVGNTDLQTERSWITALRHVARAKKITLRGSVFQTRTRNAIGFQPVATTGGDLTYTNISQTRTYGVQTGIDYRFLADWQIGTNYQWLRGTNLENDSELFLQPRHRVALTINRDALFGFGLSGQATWTSRQGFFDLNRNRVIDGADWAESYWMTSLEAGYGFRVRGWAELVRLFVRVDNALDVVHPTTFPGEPRSFSAGGVIEL